MHIGQRIKEVMKAKKISAVKVAKEISCENCPNAAMCKGQCKVEEGA